MHYGQAVPFLAICAPSLLQLIHAPNPAPSLIDEASLSFDWDASLTVTSISSGLTSSGSSTIGSGITFSF